MTHYSMPRSNDPKDAKEYLRKVFQIGALDVTHSYESVFGFVTIFAGEPEAVTAIRQCSFLTARQINRLLKLADVEGD